MESIPTLIAVYSLILLVVFVILIIKLRNVKRTGDERQIALFYRSSYDGMLGGIFGYLIVILMKVLKTKFGVPEIYFSWFPSPIVIAIVTMYISYYLRAKSE